MKKYTDKIIEEFTSMEEVNNMNILKTTSEEYLFMVNHNGTNMDVEKSDVFHNIISKALLMCKREISYIQLTVPLLFTRVKVPDEDNWKNLLRMIKYIQETLDDKLA